MITLIYIIYSVIARTLCVCISVIYSFVRVMMIVDVIFHDIQSERTTYTYHA